jgi:hypothetical protein
MRQYAAAKAARIVAFVIIGGAVFGFIVRSLWNVLVPPIFGWHTITFWQAVGLIVLSKILFGGFHRHGERHGGWNRRMKERMEQMTPEDRERFRRGMRCRQNPFTSTVEPQI